MVGQGLKDQIDKAATLIEALPYIQAFRGKVVVIKYGGSTMVDEGGEDTVPKDIVFMQSVGMRPVIVHGGGPAINQRLQEQGVETRRVNGLRVTDMPTMKVVEDVLFGEVFVCGGQSNMEFAMPAITNASEEAARETHVV